MPRNYLIPDIEEKLHDQLQTLFGALTIELDSVLKTIKSAQVAWNNGDEDTGFWIDTAVEELESIIQV